MEIAVVLFEHFPWCRLSYCIIVRIGVWAAMDVCVCVEYDGELRFRQLELLAELPIVCFATTHNYE